MHSFYYLHELEFERNETEIEKKNNRSNKIFSFKLRKVLIKRNFVQQFFYCIGKIAKSTI